MTSGFEVEPILPMVELSFATTMPGAQCAMTSGELLMLMWSVDNLDLLGQVRKIQICYYSVVCGMLPRKLQSLFDISPQVLYLFAMPSLAGGLVASSWITWHAQARSPDLLTALQVYLACTIASTVKMLVSAADLVRDYTSSVLARPNMPFFLGLT